ncbi:MULTISPECIES: SDR family oxidoreductase [Proteiniphilum]|jgi:NAD(P)-dependent dehydrogenase (short-subunit alcohol dehydrogenase family)|uniref:SDR family oxidoreductase n=1 Tax=Proteiniphilum TaxID=294702 RepID=UPI001EEA792F|nr:MULTISPECIES: SDR family oxidoreductase [Proteiniphilum]ULB33073.1 SDR family oxidoreductase [Proteiniphilum propionicum]
MKQTKLPHIIVTGGAQGIGRVISQELLKNGYTVSIFDIDSEAMEELRPHLNKRRCDFFITDVSNEVSIRSSIRAAVKKFGNTYGLVNNAVYEVSKPMDKLSLEEWNRAIATNLTGTFLCSKYLAPYLEESKGAIVNMCSTRAFQSEANTESYSASKGGIFSLTHAMAVSLAPNVRVNSISPGWIDVSALKKKSVAKQALLSREDHLQHPSGRVGNAWDIARMVLFLMNPENSFITGQNFIIDGGMTRKMIYV